MSLTQRLDLRSLNKHAALQSLSIYYTLKNIRQQYKNNTLKIIFPIWNDGFELPDGSSSVSDIQYYIWYKKQKTWSINPLMLLFMFTSTGLILD